MSGRGARSILGSLPAYAKTSVLAFVVIAVVMWTWLSEDRFGGDVAASTAHVALAASSTWSEVTLDDGGRQHVLTPGAALDLPPGAYSVVGFAGERTALADVDLSVGEVLDLDALLSRDAPAR